MALNINLLNEFRNYNSSVRQILEQIAEARKSHIPEMRLGLAENMIGCLHGRMEINDMSQRYLPIIDALRTKVTKTYEELNLEAVA